MRRLFSLGFFFLGSKSHYSHQVFARKKPRTVLQALLAPLRVLQLLAYTLALIAHLLLLIYELLDLVLDGVLGQHNSARGFHFRGHGSEEEAAPLDPIKKLLSSGND